MYKIYCNEHQLVLSSREPDSPEDWSLVARYHGKAKLFFPILDAMEKRTGQEQIWVYHENVEELWAVFLGLFVRVEAAGGLVFNSQGQILVIFRRNVLDLPKGKLEPGETEVEGACREVMEETGLRQVTCGPKLGETWHIFREKKKRMIKHTVWYEMSADQVELVPQTEEGIQDVRWIAPEDYLISNFSTFRNIRDMIRDTLGRAEMRSIGK